MPVSGFVQHEGSSVNPKRQRGPHAHSINVSADDRFAFVADLGIDYMTVFYAVIGMVYWQTMARVVRGQVLSLKRAEFIEAARVFAGRIVREGGDSDSGRLDFAFRIAVLREPDNYERKVLTQLLEANLKHYEADPDAARQVIGAGLAPVPDTKEPAELAAWTAVARAVLNLSETTTRN